MSVTDRAFIRAYSQRSEASDGGVEATPALTPRQSPQRKRSPSALAAGIVPAPHSRSQGRTVTTESHSGAARRHYLPSPHSLFSVDTPSSQVVLSPTDKVPAAETTSRRPLSEFAPPDRVVEEFRPSFEVDQFGRPDVCRDLVDRCEAQLGQLESRLRELCAEEHNVVAVVGAQPGVGCTTMAVAIADRLVSRGNSVVLVDADFQHAGLANGLGTASVHGWEEVLKGNHDLQEAVIQATAEPLAAVLSNRTDDPERSLIGSLRASTSIEILRQHYDLVLIDYGALQQPGDGPEPDLSKLGVHALIGVAASEPAHGFPWDTMQAGSSSLELAGVVLNLQPSTKSASSPNE